MASRCNPKTSARRLLWLHLVLGLVFALLGGCKQGEGDNCQVDDDCSAELECNSSTGLCQQAVPPVLDATPSDAATPDIDAASPPIDAANPPVDATSALPDSGFLPDASL